MLIDEPMVFVCDPILAFISDGVGVTRLETGCYLIGHHGSSDFLPKYEHWAEIESVGCSGVCDSLEQLKAKFTERDDPDRKFVITLTEVRKDQQPPRQGWRWHKWGEYIGTHQIQHEYLYDEEGIERVFCYHIYEKKR